MGKGQELLDAAREGDRKIVEKILGQITKRSGPFTRQVIHVFIVSHCPTPSLCYMLLYLS